MTSNPEGLDEEQRDDRSSERKTRGSSERRAFKRNKGVDARYRNVEKSSSGGEVCMRMAGRESAASSAQAEKAVSESEVRRDFRERVVSLFATEEKLLGELIQDASCQNERDDLLDRLADLEIFKKDLEKLGTPFGERQAREYPQYVAGALAKLAGWMSSDSSSARSEDGRDLFVDCLAKLYPELQEPPVELTGRTVNMVGLTFLSASNRGLNNLHLMVEPLRNAQKMRLQYPGELLIDLQELVGTVGMRLEEVREAGSLSKQDLIELAAAEKAMYELLLLQGAVLKEIYGLEAVVEGSTTERGKEVVEGRQSWLNLGRERSFDVLRQAFRQLEGIGSQEQRERKFQEWFLGFVNNALEGNGQEPLKPADVSSVFLGEFPSDSASKIAGTEIVRSVVCFKDFQQYQKMVSRMDDSGESNGTGMFIPGEAFDEGHLLRQTGLILSTANDYFIQHEIRHSIDPYVGERSGEGLILAEAFALYWQVVVESGGAEQERFGSLTDVLKRYYDSYLEESKLPMSREEFDLTCEKLTNVLWRMRKKRGDLETQRMLVQSKTMTDLLQLAR